MQIKILHQDKHQADIQLDNVTVAEILRVYAYKAGADFAAWRREHPSKPVVLKIQSSDKNVSKVLADTVALIGKECGALISSLKK
ncbi:hypothetical protein HYZ97_00195 [Candidatus Pacearchaeota archaeon]|nr:hypothetical protein [Candidatus Pacearchaeota archaeon]